MNSCDAENHMVIDNESSDVEREREYEAHDERERVNEAALVLLNGGTVKKVTSFHFPVATFDDVITSTFESHTINECIKQILLIVPHSKLSQLIRDKAREVAADALDIIMED